MDAADDIRRRADAGDAEALITLGKALLAKRDVASIRDGIALVQRATALGSSEACAQLAVLTASGMAGPPRWDVAFDLLLRAAESGHAPALADLKFLSRDTGNDFAALRARIDIASWLQPPEPSLLHEPPRIFTCAGFFSPAECQRLITLAKPKLTRALVFNSSSGAGMASDVRTNSKAELTTPDFDLPLTLMFARISALLGVSAVQFEPANVLHYSPGEEFSPHYDFLDDSPGLAANKHEGGQRILTCLVYLNADFEAGETAFPRLGLAHKGKTGDAIIFRNVDASGAPDLETLHAGTPPTRGEKWLLSQWVRDRPQGVAARAST